MEVSCQKKITVREGDLLCIPVDDSFVAAKLLWVSDWNKNVMGIAVYARRFASSVTLLDEFSEYAVLKMGREDVTVVYPSAENVTKKKIWTVIGHRPLDDADRMLRRHIIGGSLYDGDDEIRRPATGEDYTLYSSVMTAPALVVLNLIRAAMDQFPMAGR
ncbi:hypothetical protein [Shinella zoogloeoides]